MSLSNLPPQIPKILIVISGAVIAAQNKRKTNLVGNYWDLRDPIDSKRGQTDWEPVALGIQVGDWGFRMWTRKVPTCSCLESSGYLSSRVVLSTLIFYVLL